MATFKGLHKTCECCGAPFKVPQSLARVRTCSRECGYKVRAVANKKEAIKLSCAHCGVSFTERPCHAERRVFCSPACQHSSPDFARRKGERMTGEKNPAWNGGQSIPVVSSSGRAYRRQAIAGERARCARRRALRIRATPPWADTDAMRAFYVEAERRTQETGEPHHVDHALPLNSRLVCGLHNQFNLQVLTAKSNLSKGNRL